MEEYIQAAAEQEAKEHGWGDAREEHTGGWRSTLGFLEDTLLQSS